MIKRFTTQCFMMKFRVGIKLWIIY